MKMEKRRKLLLALGLLLAAPVLPAAVPEGMAFLPDDEVIARAAPLPIEDRRYLVYLYARLNKPLVARTIAEQLLAENPSDRQTLLVLASMSAEQKDAQETLRLANRFLEFYPGDHQGLYFLGAGLYLAKRYAEANAVLRDLKHEQFASRKYPYETDLAASAYAAGDWYHAMLSYQELLRHHQLGDELRDEVRRVLDSIYREHRSRVDFTASGTRLNRARVWRYTAGEAAHLDDRHWLALSYTRDDVTLDAAPSIRSVRSARAEAAASITTVHDGRWTSDTWVGASGAGLLGGARLRYAFAKERTAQLEISINARSTDSLALELLDGRENRAVLGVAWRIEADLTLAAQASFRQLYLAHQRLGEGAGIDLSLDQTITRQAHGPQFVVGYRGSYGAFTPEGGADPTLVDPVIEENPFPGTNTGVLGNLVARRINRHGLALNLTDNMGDAWVYRFRAGGDYDFELSSVGWNAGLALTFYPRKSIELTSEFGYSSSANASNAGSSAYLLNFFVRSYY